MSDYQGSGTYGGGFLAGQVPPGAWWDIPGTVAAALAIMRMDQSDEDVPRVEAAAVAVCSLIDEYLNRVDPMPSPTPGPVRMGAVFGTVEAYRRKDAPFGVLDSFSASDLGPTRIGADVLRGIESMIRPYKQQWGVA